MNTTTPTLLLEARSQLGQRIKLSKRSRLDSTLARLGDRFLVIEKGAAVVFAGNATADPFFLSVVGPDHVFTPSFAAMRRNCEPSIGVQAITDCTMRLLCRKDWHSLSAEHSELDRSVIEQSVEQLQIVQFHLAQQCTRSSIERTRFALYSYAKCLGNPSPCGRLAVSLSRAELASWISVSVDRVSRIVRKLHQDGEITITGRSILIKPDLIGRIQGKGSRVA